DQVFRRVVRSIDSDLKLTVIEWYILRALYETDGQHASELASAVGRAATSFTPNLDKLQDKGLIERRPDLGDRRAVRIHLTEAGLAKRNDVLDAAKRLDKEIASMFAHNDFETFLDVVNRLQSVELDS
ncbi:MAG: MarR family transcriptional regulator, partial [Chloroflexota bacterium]